MALGEAVVKIVPDTSGFSATLKKDVDAALSGIDKAVDKTAENIEKEFKEAGQQASKSVDGINKSLKDIAKTAAVAFVAREAFNFAKGAIAAAEAAEISRNRIQQVAKSMDLFGDEVGKVTDRLVEYAEQTARQTGIDDDQIQLAQAKLLTFKNLAITADEMGGAFDRATQAAIDMGAAGFGDAAGNAVQLGKALQDPIKGITALNRSGITFTADQKELIRTLVETNRVAEAQDLILSAIEQQVGGTAAATASSSAKMRIAFEELQEEVGTALLPAFESLTSVLTPIFDGFGKLPPSIQGVISNFALMGIGAIALKRSLDTLGIASTKINTVMKGLGFALAGLTIAQGVGQLLNEISDSSGNLDRKLQSLVIALGDLRKASKDGQDPLEAFRDLVAAEGREFNLANIIRDVGKEITVVGGSIGRDIEYIDNAFNTLLSQSPQYAQELLDAWMMQAEGLDVTSQQYEDNIMLIERYQDRIDLATGASDAMADAQSGVAGGLDDAASAAELAEGQMADYVKGLGFVVDESGEVEYSQENLAKAVEIAQERFDDAVQAVNDYEDALKDAFDAARSSIDTGFALVESQLEATNAVKEYEKAVKNGNTSQAELDKLARETAQTMLTVADNTVANAAALAAMNGESLTTAQTQEMMVTELENFRDTLDPASPLAQYLNGFITTLNGVPSEIPVELLAEVDVAQSELEAFKEAALEIGNQITIGILRALAPLSPEFKKILDDMLRQAGKDLDFNIRINVTASGTSYVTTPYGSMPIKTQSNVTGTVSADVQPKTLSDISQYLSFANGGIFDQPQIGLFAEAGAEAIIPLTRPARALELMRDSGLLGLAQSESGAGQNFDITVVSAEPMRTAKDVVREFQALEYRMAPL